MTAFVDLAEIDPMYFDRSYWMAPPEKNAPKGTERAYALLVEAMRQSGRAALATFVMRERQHLPPSAHARRPGTRDPGFRDEIVERHRLRQPSR